jgi:hypothetical protein
MRFPLQQRVQRWHSYEKAPSAASVADDMDVGGGASGSERAGAAVGWLTKA